MNKEKELKTAGYQETKDQDKIKQIICSYFQNMRQKKEIPADAVHFFRKEFHSTDLKNENLTTKIRRNKAEKPHLFKKNIAKDLEKDETIK